MRQSHTVARSQRSDRECHCPHHQRLGGLCLGVAASLTIRTRLWWAAELMLGRRLSRSLRSPPRVSEVPQYSRRASAWGPILAIFPPPPPIKHHTTPRSSTFARRGGTCPAKTQRKNVGNHTSPAPSEQSYRWVVDGLSVGGTSSSRRERVWTACVGANI